MPFPFTNVCDLLQAVADLPPQRRGQRQEVNRVVQAWFARHRAAVDEMMTPAPNSSSPNDSGRSTASGPASAAALLATLLPDLRPDRVYGIQAKGLERVIVRALGLGHSRALELARWARPGEQAVVDLADCVQAILERTPNPAGVNVPAVSVEEVDATLHALAARCRFSSPAVRASASAAKAALPSDEAARAPLGRLYQRLAPRDAKWLTRLVLKDYRPEVELDAAAVARAVHPHLPLALRVHASDVAAAVQACAATTTAQLNARLGVKVGRQQWAKARSIKHCLAMAGPQRMSCERKMDGEYVQVHVDLSRGKDEDCLQIFSKSGKDSTRDRAKLHSAILESLRIGQPDCKIKKGCILEGEMLAYDERENQILDFDAIRKHVTRSGHALYCAPNETQDYEHLMIVYYDVLLIDDESLLATRHSERFERLQGLVTCRLGYAELVWRRVIDFRHRTAAQQLRVAFAQCIAARREGLVLKPDDDPYFDFSPLARDAAKAPAPVLEWPYLKSYAIKLKKEYIGGGVGEVGDFAIVGARYDASKAKEYEAAGLKGVRWTHFFLGCLDVRPTKYGQRKTASRSARPRFIVTNIVTLTAQQMKCFLTHCRPQVIPVERPPDRRLRTRHQKQSAEQDERKGDGHAKLPYELAPLEPGLDQNNGGPTELFADPPVVDIRCFAWHRQGYGRFWSPRFPTVTKFHFDRTCADAVTFADLQAMAEADAARRSDVAGADGGEDDEDEWAMDDLLNEDALSSSQRQAYEEEKAHWVAELRRADPRGVAVDAETSQSSNGGATESTTAGRSQLSGAGRSQSEPAERLRKTPSFVVIEEETEPEEDESDKKGTSQESTVTLRFSERKPKDLSMVTVIDLTGDDDDDDDDGTTTPRAATTPRATTPLPPLIALPQSPTTPMTTPPSSSSPVSLGSSSSPFQPMSSLATVLTTPSPARRAGAGTSSGGGDVKRSSPGSSGGQRAATGDSGGEAMFGNKRRVRTWDAASLQQVVSPPQLKRARTSL